MYSQEEQHIWYFRKVKVGTLSSWCDLSGHNNIAEINAGILIFPKAKFKVRPAKARKQHKNGGLDDHCRSITIGLFYSILF